ncbi:MAG: serine/threonine-protein kinase [Gemmatimonadaceae bacterium]
MTPSPQDLSAGVLREQLQESLGDAYAIERELGGGGMSRVFVARERSLDRLVVVKVLPHELAAGMNSERFRREIQLVAGLQHPHIVPVLAAGEAAGAPFYTMPFIDGESLRTRRGKTGTMPLGDAVRVLHDVIDALAYAHERGIVHRDIKPDNILMSGVHAVVTDFGVAKALSEANVAFRDVDASGTGIGMAVGTPAYMAPEQAAGDPETDHRADIYAWGLLAYELLAGAPPFSPRSSHEMLAAHIAEIPESLSDREPDLPQSLADLVMQCLEKRPASRPQSAVEVRDALERAATPGGGTPIMPRRWNRRPRLTTLVSLGVLAIAVAGAFAFRPRTRPLDGNQVAVMPFRLASADPSLRYLREGMLDLLAAKLTGEGGPRSSDPRTLLSAWRRAVKSDTEDLPRDRALDLAEKLGAGQLLIGDIAGNAQHLTITATLLWVRDGRADAPRSVSGPADSLSAMVDRLASELLALRAGEGERIGAFAGVPLPALRAYLDGTALYRKAHFANAAREFDRAIGLDSTFALAGLGLSNASGWVGSPKDQFRGRTVAWHHRERLNPRDRALLLATAGPNFPGTSGWTAMIAAKERYAALAPDRADAQFELGDGLFHFGAAAGIPDAHGRAIESFNRAIALDSSFSPAIEHLVVLELERGDTARVIRLAQLYLDADSTSENRDGMRFSLAIARGDTAAARAVLGKRDSLSTMAKVTISELPYVMGRSIDAAQTVIDTPTDKDADLATRLLDLVLRHDIAMNRGRPARGAARLDSMRTALPNSDDSYRVTDALFWDGDSASADASAQALRRKAALGGPVPGTFKRGRDPGYYGDLCIAELWYLSRGDTTGAHRVSGIMLANYDSRDSLSSPPFRMGCALMLDAQLAVMQGRPDARMRVDSLDAFLRTAPEGPILRMANLVSSRLYERLGDTRAALFAVRRRDFFFGRATFLSTYLRDEARLAEKAGDTAGAAEALRQFVALRGEPEPALAGEATAARDAHTRLSRSLAGR